MSKPTVAASRRTPKDAGPTRPPLAPAPPAIPTPMAITTPTATDSVTALPDTAFVPKVYQPQDIACPHQNPDLTNCGAGAGEFCNWQQPGNDGAYHAERIADADAASQREGIKPTQDQFDQAAADSGLF
jgi:hypothetical protein